MVLVYISAVELDDVQRLEVATACDLLPSEFDAFEAVVIAPFILKSLYAEYLAARSRTALARSPLFPRRKSPISQARDSILFSERRHDA